MAQLCDKSNYCGGYEEGQCWLMDCYERKDENIIGGKRLFGSTELPGYVTKKEHEKVCKSLGDAHELIDKLWNSGCLDMDRDRMIQDFFAKGA